MNYQSTLDKIASLVETWHSNDGTMPLEDLYRMRRELASNYFFLAGQIKPLFVARSSTYLTRKRNVAAAIIEAMSVKRGMSKAEAEASVEALAKTHVDKLNEMYAEAEVDALRVVLRSIDKVLDAISHEIAGLRDERQRANFLDSLDGVRTEGHNDPDEYLEDPPADTQQDF